MAEQEGGILADLQIRNSKILREVDIGLKGGLILPVKWEGEHSVRLSGVRRPVVGHFVAINIVISSTNQNMIWRNRELLEQFRQPFCGFLILVRPPSIRDISTQADNRRSPLRLQLVNRGDNAFKGQLP
jgi:hypothetical protein